jgi:protein involved in polysaccharide export with SLBB domain
MSSANLLRDARVRRASCLLALFALTACKSSPDKRILQHLNTEGFGKRYTGNAEEANYVTIGDQITITDLYHEELTVTQRVDIDGTVVLPEIGAVHVAGMTRTELEAFLLEKYAPFYEQLDIKARLTARGKRYFIFGEVRADGERPFNGDLTVFEAVTEAVPDELTANLGRVKLIRPDPVDPLVIYVNLDQMVRNGDSTFNVHVQENDIIYVPPTFLGQIGLFLRALITPITAVLREITSALSGFYRFGRYDGFFY